MDKFQLTMPVVRETQLAWARRVLYKLIQEWRRKKRIAAGVAVLAVGGQ